LVAVETAEGAEYLVVNREHETELSVPLPDGGALRTDAFVVRIASAAIMMAGGTYAALGDRVVRQAHAGGSIVAATSVLNGSAHGCFATDTAFSDPQRLAGRIAVIRQGDGRSRGWTIEWAENVGPRAGRLFVREESGFRIDPEPGDVATYQHARRRSTGRPQFAIDLIGR
jgi:hypothetical protein